MQTSMSHCRWLWNLANISSIRFGTRQQVLIWSHLLFSQLEGIRGYSAQERYAVVMI